MCGEWGVIGVEMVRKTHPTLLNDAELSTRRCCKVRQPCMVHSMHHAGLNPDEILTTH